MICVNCKIEFDETEEGSHVLCGNCTNRRSRSYLKAQIGLMSRLAKLTDDKNQLEEIAKRQVQYLEELNVTF